MYLNIFQKYIDELLTTFGPLLKRQLLVMVNHKFNTKFYTIDGYVWQMCSFADYEEYEAANNVVVAKKGTEPDYDIIRSFDVMLEFAGDITEFRRGDYPVSICFYAETKSHTKEISIIPVREGTENGLCEFITDLSQEKCQTVILLTDRKNSIKRFKGSGNILFAMIDKNGVRLFKT